MNKKLMVVIFTIILLVISLKNTFALECQGPPDQFYGTLKINDDNASIGTEVRGVVNDIEEGSYITTVDGQYGNENTADKLYVSCSTYGETIHFEVKVNGVWVDSEETASCGCGATQRVDIDVEVTIPEDSDGDGYTSDIDCDDTDASINPGATEIKCDGIDQDCSGDDDEGTDSDGDGYKVDGGLCGDIDCDDTDASINPGASEWCDGIDNDCDESTSDGVAEPGYGDITACGVGECASTGLYLCMDGDMVDTCEEGEPTEEICDGEDNNCDGNIDEDVLITFYQDLDHDNYGNPYVSELACSELEGYVQDNTDCDDTNNTINPGATEICDGVDNDCDDEIDEDNVCGQECSDNDDDEVCDEDDICPGFDDSVDNDNDGIPDGCDSCEGFDDYIDTDGDSIPDDCDVCPNDVNNDADGDTICGDVDNCPTIYNPNQTDLDDDGVGYACDDDETTTVQNVTIQIYEGWTLFALPFNPIGIENSEELGQRIMDSGNISCEVIMKFNGETQLWEDDILGLGDPTFSLLGTEGYFINCNNTLNFTYQGTVWE
jgi:hypothetical protein